MSASKTNPSFLWRSAHGYTVLLWSLQIFSSRVERGTAQLLLPNSLTHGGLIRLPLVTGKEAHRRQRDLQETPQEEEGHPQQVDALYQGYGEHVSSWARTKEFASIALARDPARITHPPYLLPAVFHSMLICGVVRRHSVKLS
jgi:hypothetical protein